LLLGSLAVAALLVRALRAQPSPERATEAAFAEGETPLFI